MTVIYQRHWQRRDTAANLAAINEVLYSGEICVETDSPVGAHKFGDGVSPWNDLPYNTDPFFSVAVGADTITATFFSKPVLVDGLQLRVRAAAANTGAVTFNPSGLGALAVTKLGGAALSAGDIGGAGHELLLRYVAGGGFELLNPAAASLASVIHGATGKTTPADADELALIDSAASNVLKKLTWANLRAALGLRPKGVVVLTDASTIALDASLGDNFRVTLGGNRTLGNPTNLSDGQTFNIRIVQDATGSRTLAYGTKFKFPGGTAPVLTTTASARDFLSCQYDATNDTIYAVLNKAFA